LLVEFPGLGTQADDVRRVHILRDFPYSLIYREDEAGIRILAVRSQYRDPEYGESRF
jgi:plasmid stabilization system protein ParE